MSKHCPKDCVLWSSVRPLLMVALLASLVAALPSPEATADAGITAGTTITVTITADVNLANDGECSLREAISAANSNTPSGLATGECPAGSGNDTIVLDSETYYLDGLPGDDLNISGDLDINSNITIQGAGSDWTVIDGGHNDRVLHIVSGNVDISGLRIRNGNLAGDATIGGGICNYGNGALGLNGVVVHHNTAGGSGGGIYSVGLATLTGTTLRDNKATEGWGGGYFGVGALTVTDSTIRHNTADLSGGGLYNPWAMITLTNSTIRENRTTGGGGGGLACGDLTMTDSAVVTNTASKWGGGISAGVGVVTLTNSSVNGNTANAGGGGGINAVVSGTVTLNNSTVNGNTAGGDGGGISVADVGLTKTDSHVDDNTAGGEGGGVWSDISLTMENGSVSGNEAKGGNGGGVYAIGFDPGSLVEMKGVIVSGNKTTGAYGDGGGVYCVMALTLQDSTVTGNTASSSGGGIWGYSTLTVEDSTIKGNTAGSVGGLGRGGGIAGQAALIVNRTTISGNKAQGLFGYGGGIWGESYLTLTNSTLSGNKADWSGGGLYRGGTSSGTLSNVTVASNIADDDGDGTGNGGGIAGATLIVKNSLIANNKVSASNNDCYLAPGTLTSQDYNLVETPGATCIYDSVVCPACFGQPGSDDVTGQDPKLAALADNGGATWTQALQSDSPALDKIPNGTNGCGASPLDRFTLLLIYPFFTADSCDMGAYETQSGFMYMPTVLRQ